ncbi:transcriptional regulator [Clostridium tetani]|nr:transcriptional regulator [Clostridium tetani]RXM74833.1 transcriptional regulator [Clostridium tetani]RYU98217.1 transcriptional regulator [Clostridium tetani]
MNMEILSLGEKIKRRRKELNMTLKDLAGDRITPGQISLVESGKSNPSMDLLEYLSEALDVSIEYLMETEETQAEKVCYYFENIAEAHILNNDLSLGEEYTEKALYYAEKYNLEYKKAKNFYLRGLIYMRAKNPTLAQQALLAANVVFIKNNKYEEIIKSFVNLGKITLELKAYHSSYSYFQQAEKVYNDNNIGDDFLLGEIYYYMSYTNLKLENLDKSINYSFLAKEKFKQLDNEKEYGKILIMMAEQYSKSGNITESVKYSQKALGIFKKMDDKFYMAQIENNLGKLFSEFENIEESFIHLNKAKELRLIMKDDKLIETLINICENYIKIRDIDGSNRALENIFKNIKDDDKESLIKYYILKYKIHMLEGELNKAENTLVQTLSFVKNVDYLKDAAEISIMLGKFYIDIGKEKDAATYLNEGVTLFKKIGVLKEG